MILSSDRYKFFQENRRISRLHLFISFFLPFVLCSMEVHLNIYDLHESNRYLHSVGGGFYHTGVEINNYEYSFSNAGISRTRPRLPDFGQLREHLVMGIFSGSMSEVNQILEVLRNGDFREGAYNVTSRNCNHFSDAFMMLLLEVHIPVWVNRMANVASSLPISKQDSNALSKNDSFAAPGAVKEPSLKNVKMVSEERDLAPSATSITDSGMFSSVFSWFGTSKTKESTSSVSSGVVSVSKESDSGGPTSTTTVARTTASTTTTTTTKSSNPTGKKELTEQQKKLLAKLKEKP
jgi:hypothetical protein